MEFKGTARRTASIEVYTCSVIKHLSPIQEYVFPALSLPENSVSQVDHFQGMERSIIGEETEDSSSSVVTFGS